MCRQIQTSCSSCLKEIHTQTTSTRAQPSPSAPFTKTHHITRAAHNGLNPRQASCTSFTFKSRSNTSLTDWSSYLFSPTSPLRPYLSPVLSTTTSYLPLLKTYTTTLTNALTQKPDLATLALLLLILILSLKLLNMLLNTVLFWIRLAFRVVFWSALGLLGVWMWTRGPEGVLEDLGMWAGRWQQEYRRIQDGQQEVVRGRREAYGRERGAGW